ncbi:MAG: thermonuclease family protein [Thermodesulfobacteriota bacterium]
MSKILRWSIKPYLLVSIISLLLVGVAVAQNLYLCTRAVDGDTIVVNIEGKHENVRLIGVDTPETVHPFKPVEYYGKEASEFTKSMVEGKQVRLEYDWQKRDKYGRLLAYVFLTDGTFINAEIVKQGYGHAYTRFPFKYLEEFRRYEREARENNRGLWKEDK